MLSPVAVFAQAGLSAQAKRVAELRGEVDRLAEALSSQRRASQDVLSALRAERAELTRQLRLEQVRTETLAKVAAERRARASGLEDQSQERLDPVRRAVAAAKAYVQGTLPFKREERLKRLGRIEADLASAHPDASGALARLWRFVEEEEALSREVGLSQQVISIDDQRQLVDVARIGMALLYFRTAAGGFGWVVATDTGWRFERLEGEAASSVAALFAALDQNRTFGQQVLLLPEVKK